MDGSAETKPAIAYDQRLARRVARPLARTAITPNMITSAALAAGLAAAWLFARGDAAGAHWGGLLFMLSCWLDHLDGELARASGKVSRFGHYYDNVAMMVSYVATFVGMGLGLDERGAGDHFIPLGVAAGTAIAVIFGMRMWIEARFGSTAVAMKPVVGFEVEDILYLIGPIAWLGLVEPFVVAAAIGAPLFLAWTAVGLFRKARAKGSRSATQ